MTWDTTRADGDVYYAADHNETITQIKAKALIANPTFTGTAVVPTLDTGVAAAGVTLTAVTLAADGTDANIPINITSKGTSAVVIGPNASVAGVVPVEAAVGFTLEGGTSTSKTLTVDETVSMSGKLNKTANVTAINETGIADGEICVFNATNKDIRTSDKTIVTSLGADDLTVPTSKAVADVTNAKAPIASPTFTGNVTIPAGTHSIKVADYVTLYVTGAMIPKTNPPAVFDQDETSTNKNNYVYAAFPTSDNNTNLQWLVNFPADWTATGNIEANFIWTCATGGDTVIWQLYGKLFPDSAALDTALPQIATDVTDTALDTGDIMVSPATTAAAITSVGTGGNTAIFSVKRNSGTKSEVAKLIAVRIKFLRTLA